MEEYGHSKIRLVLIKKLTCRIHYKGDPKFGIGLSQIFDRLANVHTIVRHLKKQKVSLSIMWILYQIILFRILQKALQAII